jgi:hypothetical protein
MDPDKSIDIYTFNGGSQHVGTATEENHKDFVKKAGLRADGGTNYAPVMHEIIGKYGTPIKPTQVTETSTKEVPAGGFLGKLFGKTKTVTETTTKTVLPADVKPVQVPTLVFFITDGENWDQGETARVIKEASKQGIFWQFVGIGDERFEFLKQLDELQGRFIDNANFFEVNDIMKISDEQLYDRVLNEFPTWLKEAKTKGLIL